MRVVSALERTALSAIACALALFASPQAFGQAYANCPKQVFADLVAKPAAPTGSAPLFSAVTVAPGEEAAYKAFSKLKPDNTDKRIQAGEAFVQKYPLGSFSESVYSQLTFAEYQKQDFTKMDKYADKALELSPDNLQVLVLVGWVIPHAADPDPAQLDKAEKYEKHILELLPTVIKPAGMTDQELATAKSQYESQAHSGLGLVYYQRNDFDGAVAEMKKATSGASQPDPADYFVLGDSLDSLDRFSDAADAFEVCAGIPGGEQAVCRQKAEAAKKNASSALTVSTTP